jgi:hypothetical protein
MQSTLGSFIRTIILECRNSASNWRTKGKTGDVPAGVSVDKLISIDGETSSDGCKNIFLQVQIW